MFIQSFPSGPVATNSYIVACEETKVAAIVDPAPGAAASLNECLAAHHFVPAAIFLTHSHWDHIADVAVLKEKWNIPVYIHKDDAYNLENPGSDGLPLWISIKPVKVDHFIKEGDILKVGNLEFRVIDTPGHTPGGVCFYCADHSILLSGDTLFKRSMGNISFATARPKLMWQSLNKLSLLPSETKVFSGHGEGTTIGQESWLSRAKELFDK